MSGVSRRAVLSVGAGAVGVGLLAFTAPPAVAAAAAAVDDARGAAGLPVRSHFASSLGQQFTAQTSAGTFPVTLQAIHDLSPEFAGDENRFSLSFTTLHGHALGEIVTLRRIGVPTASLFLSSVGPATPVRSLQALVNRQA